MRTWRAGADPTLLNKFDVSAAECARDVGHRAAVRLRFMAS